MIEEYKNMNEHNKKDFKRLFIYHIVLQLIFIAFVIVIILMVCDII